MDLYHNAIRKYMPPMLRPEVYIMYCNIAITERGQLKVLQKVCK